MTKMRWMIAAAVLVSPVGAQAQSAIEGRVDRLEAEMRAVQRKVFPGGAGAQVVEPQFRDQQAPTPAPGLPSSSPITDLTARVSALESQLSTTTGQIEQMQFRLKQVEDAYSAYRRTTDARLKALEDGNASLGGGAGTDLGTPAPAPAPVRPAPGAGAPKPAAPAPATPKPAGAPPTKADLGRAALLSSIEKPATDDPAEDGYTYGYRLWQAKLYPEAIAELKDVTAKYPKHRRWSYAQNLLGRAYLDSGAPASAAKVFYDNYRTKPDGERAPDSLYYLAQSLSARKAPSADICRVYSELTEVYGSKLSAEIRNGVAQGRAAQKCP